ncbi:retrovirus-related pol polyprotein from transposon TNT 1-94 [Tanacetum coccineum]
MDSMIPLGQKNTLAEYMILSGADNRPPMLDKDLYDSWKDDLIAYLNKAMAFLTAIASSSNATSSGGNNASGQARVVKCYNCQGEGHMARQCTQSRRLQNTAWHKDKAMLAEAQEAGQILDEEQLTLLVDPGVPGGQAIQTIIPNNDAFQTEDLDTYDSDCDDISNAKAVLMANISNYGSDVISEVPHSETYLNDMENQGVHAMQDFEQPPVVDFTDNEIHSDINIIPLSDDFRKHFTPQQELLAEQAFWLRMSNPTSKPSDASPVKIEALKELPKVSLVNESLKKLKFHLARFDNVVNITTTPDARTEGEWGQFFDQMDAAVQRSSIDKQCLEIAKKELLLENDRLLQQIMSQDVLSTVMNSMSLIGESVNMDRKRKESCDKCFNLKAELLKLQNVHNESCNNQNALEIPEFFENNDLKAQLQDKDNTICKLKDIIKLMREKSKDENVNYDYGELETKNVELENGVAKLISENERLCNEINHVKQVFKEQFDSTKKTRVCTKEHSDSLIDKLNLKSAKNEDLKAQIQNKVFVITSLKNDLRKVKGKYIVDSAAQIPSAHTIVPGMFKLDLEHLDPRLLQSRKAHIHYLKYTQEQADILQGIELLVYVRDTCPNANKLSAKKVVVTPKNKVKKVRFAEPLTSSRNTKQAESSTTSDSNTRVLSLTGLKCSTSNCGSKPTGNKKNDRISQTPSRNMKNKVEAQPRKVNKKNSIVEPIHDVDVKHSLFNANSEPICATCKKSIFDGVHDMCILDFVENVNIRAKSAKKHKKLKYLETYGSPNIVPPKKTTSHSVETQKPELKVYNRKPKNVKNIGSSKKAKIVESKNANHPELNHTWGSNATYIPSSSSLVMTGFLNCSLVSRLQMFKTYDREPLSAHELCVDLISGSRDINLYTISLNGMLKTSLIRLLSKASKTKSWLWHRHLSHLNFSTFNKLAKDGLVRGIPRLKFQKDHLCSTCALGKSKKSSHQPKAKDTNQEKLYLLHMDLCGPMRVASINGKRYILVIVDNYSRFTWVRFLRTKDEAPEAIIKCIKNIQVCLNATVRNVQTDNGTEFVNQTLREFYENIGISH